VTTRADDPLNCLPRTRADGRGRVACIEGRLVARVVVLAIVISLACLVSFQAGVATADSAVRRQLPSAIKREVTQIQDLQVERERALQVIAAHLQDVADLRSNVTRSLRESKAALAEIDTTIHNLDTTDAQKSLVQLEEDIRAARENAMGFIRALDIDNLLPNEPQGQSSTDTLVRAMRDASQNSVSTTLSMFARRLDMQDANIDSLVTRQLDDKVTMLDARKSQLPVGSIVVYAGSLADIGEQYLPCDGREIKKSEYPALFEQLTETYPSCFLVSTGVCRVPKLALPPKGVPDGCESRFLVVVKARM